MTVSDREPSPFSGTGLNKGRKKAFATVAVLAALSCGWAGYGFYIDFLRVLPATATFYLTTADRMTRVSLLNPQPPEIREREKTPRPKHRRTIRTLLCFNRCAICMNNRTPRRKKKSMKSILWKKSAPSWKIKNGRC